jgi:ABC-type sugar transport system ATPase subunit
MSPAPDTSDGLRVDGLRKAYGSTQALDGLSVSLQPGEITGIAGPNGAGKSTFVRIMEGNAAADAGSIRLDGQDWSPQEQRRTAVVHQEAQLYPNLTVAQNLLVGRERSVFTRPRPSRVERDLLRELGLAAYADDPLEECPLAVRQRVEIARALVTEARIFLFDEPNSALTAAESTKLFEHMRSLADDGHVVGLVSHRLSELAEVCDRVAVILDGRVNATLEAEHLTEVELARQLVATEELLARVVTGAHAARLHEPPILSVREWTSRHDAFRGIDLDVPAGTIFALFGVEGGGGRELLRSFAGLHAARGKHSIRRLDGPQSQVEYVSADRRLSLYPHLTVGQNIVSRLARPHISAFAGALRRSKMEQIAKEFVERLSIRCRSVWQPITDLSGGNQQKVAIAAALVRSPTLLVLEEPTRGVDIRSKGEIHVLLRSFVEDGRAAALFCTEVPEVFEVATHVCVVREGRLGRVLEVSDFANVSSLAAEIAAAGGE